MNTLIRRFALLSLGLGLSGTVLGQAGGFGGGDGQEGNGIFGGLGGTQRETSLDGAWFLEFELEFDSNNPEAVGERHTVRADVTVTGIEVNARFRQPAEGEFTCTRLEGSDRCEQGRLLIVWPDEDIREAANFEFIVDMIDGRRAKGEANFVNTRSGAVRLYSVEMRKR